MKRYSQVLLLFIIGIVLIMVTPAKALEPANGFIIQDIEYQSINGAAKLRIETNEDVDYITYELKNPYRIVIDPLDPVWCDFEEAVYFDEGMVKSIKFIKGRDIPKGPGAPYYPFDFVTIELKSPYPYKFSKNEYIVTLNIGKEIPPQVEIELEEKIEDAKVIEEELSEDLARKKAALEEEEERLKEAEDTLAEKRGDLDLIKEEVMKEKKEIDIAKDELGKEKLSLEREKARLAKESARLKEKKRDLKKMIKYSVKTDLIK